MGGMDYFAANVATLAPTDQESLTARIVNDSRSVVKPLALKINGNTQQLFTVTYASRGLRR